MIWEGVEIHKLRAKQAAAEEYSKEVRHIFEVAVLPNRWTQPSNVEICAVVANGKRSTTDALVAPTPVSAPAPTPAPTPAPGFWQVDKDTNPVSGVVTTVARVGGNQNIIIRQIGKRLELYITTNQFLETTDNVETRLAPVQYKLDSGKVVRQSWELSDDNTALFYPGNPKAFIAQMRNANSLAFEYSPSGKVPDTIVFDVTGLPDVF